MKFLPKEPDDEFTRISFYIGISGAFGWLKLAPKTQTNLVMAILTATLFSIMGISVLVLILKWIYRFNNYLDDF